MEGSEFWLIEELVGPVDGRRKLSALNDMYTRTRSGCTHTWPVAQVLWAFRIKSTTRLPFAIR